MKIERRTFLGGAIAAAVVPGVYELTVEQFAALIEERVESWA